MNITATQLKQQMNLLNIINKEEIVVTKRNKPFAVIMDYEKYNELLKEKKDSEVEKKLEALNSLKSFHLGGKNHSEIKSEME